MYRKDGSCKIIRLLQNCFFLSNRGGLQNSREQKKAAKTSSQRPVPTTSTSWWTTLFLSLMTLQLQSGYKALLMAIWTLSPSRTARLMEVSTLRLTSRSMTSSTTTSLLSRSARGLAQQYNAATARARPAQGAITALQRSSLVEVQRARTRAAAEQLHHTSPDQMALEEQDGESELGCGQRDAGVGR